MSEKIELLSFWPNLFVRDVEKATAFYRDVIGMEVHVAFPDGSFAMLGGHGDAEVALVKHEDPPPGEAYLYVRGVEALLGSCEVAGSRSRDRSRHSHGGCETSSCAIPMVI